MSTVELVVLAVAGLALVILLSMVSYFNYTTSKFSSKLPEPKNYPPYRIKYDHKIFENNSWTTAICYGTSDEIAEQMKEWDETTKKNLAEYKKSAKIRGMITLRKKLKERHCEGYCKQGRFNAKL